MHMYMVYIRDHAGHSAYGRGGNMAYDEGRKRQELSGIVVAVEQVIQAAQITVGELQQTIVADLKPTA